MQDCRSEAALCLQRRFSPNPRGDAVFPLSDTHAAMPLVAVVSWSLQPEIFLICGMTIISFLTACGHVTYPRILAPPNLGLCRRRSEAESNPSVANPDAGDKCSIILGILP
jgi:hypothetical protein